MRHRLAAERDRALEPLTTEQRRQLAADCLPELDRTIQTSEDRAVASQIAVASKLRDDLRCLFAEPGRLLLPALSATERVLRTTDAVTLEDLRAIRAALQALAA